ncbi:MAG: DNA (cytosine-5-)-methyltransferase [Bacteroidales bacterium]
MYDQYEIRFFRSVLLNWFKTHKRDFPWRSSTVTAYEIILSEILLQKTKAQTVAKFFSIFFMRFPDWEALCSTNIQELEEILHPLGLYKHRAKRIHRIIQDLVKRNGILPRNLNELHESNFNTLYVSNAYELFVFKNRSALLDVNMARVLTRFFFPREAKDVRLDKELQNFAKNVLNVRACKELNWSILDFAALICKSTKPKCVECPLNSKCAYYNKQQPTDDYEEQQLSMSYEILPDINPAKPLKVLSLFSGCGGMDLGFEGNFIVHEDSVNEVLNPDFIQRKVDEHHVLLNPTKFQTVFANDILEEAQKAWVSYFRKKGYPSEIYHVNSIVDLVKLHKLGVKIFPDQVDIVTGGFPCQDFSLSGLRNGFNSHKDHLGKIARTDVATYETRGQLYMWLKEVVEITKPKIFIAENVKGLVNLANVKEIIQNDFAKANENGYLVLNPMVLHAADFGVPQSRERVIFIGIKKSALLPEALKELSNDDIIKEYYPYPSSTHSFKAIGSNLKAPVKLRTMFEGLQEPESSSDPSQKYYSKAKFMGKHCQGQTEINLDSIGPTIRSEHHGNIEFRRLSKMNGGKISVEIEKLGLRERRLTPRECALIQTFPPDYEFVIPSGKANFFISPSSAYKLIGNAVPPLLAYHIAKRIEKVWSKYFKESNHGNINKSRTTKEIVSTTVG